MLKGSWTALITPFEKDNSVDFETLGKLIELQIAGGINGILLLGTTAETPALSDDEKEQIITFAMEKIAGRTQVMIGTGTNNIDKTIAATQKAAKHNPDYALVITPYYNKTSQEGLFEYFSEVARNSMLPIVIYNVPPRTGINLSAKTTVKLARQFKNIVGIKDATGDLVQATRILRDAPESFSLISGNDDVTLQLMAVGARGVISVSANVVPSLISEMVSLWEKGDTKKAKQMHLYLLELNESMFLVSNPIPVKDALFQMGIIKKNYRLPMVEMSQALQNQLKQTLQKYDLVG